MSSDELQIDPDLDKEEAHDSIPSNTEPARGLASFFATPNASASSSSAQNAPTKKKAPRRLKAAAADIKQTRLGAGLKPVRLQLEPQVAESDESVVGNDATPLIESSGNGKSRKSRKRKDEEGQEMKEMAKSAKGNAASKKAVLPKGQHRKGELVEDMDTELETETGGESSKHPKGLSIAIYVPLRIKAQLISLCVFQVGSQPNESPPQCTLHRARHRTRSRMLYTSQILQTRLHRTRNPVPNVGSSVRWENPKSRR